MASEPEPVVFPKGKLIRKAREHCGYTLSEVQAWIGRDQSHLSKIERGHYAPSLRTKVDLVRHLEGLKLGQIITRDERDLIEVAASLLKA